MASRASDILLRVISQIALLTLKPIAFTELNIAAAVSLSIAAALRRASIGISPVYDSQPLIAITE